MCLVVDKWKCLRTIWCERMNESLHFDICICIRRTLGDCRVFARYMLMFILLDRIRNMRFTSLRIKRESTLCTVSAAFWVRRHFECIQSKALASHKSHSHIKPKKIYGPNLFIIFVNDIVSFICGRKAKIRINKMHISCVNSGNTNANSLFYDW